MRRFFWENLSNKLSKNLLRFQAKNYFENSKKSASFLFEIGKLLKLKIQKIKPKLRDYFCIKN